jgi:sterol 3beta-glucosyltransferase
MFDQVFWRATSGQINRWRRKTLGLPSTSLELMEPHKIPFLYNFSPTVVPPPLDWPDWIRITGYWFLDSAEVGATAWTPPPELAAFIADAHAAGKKVVYIGFGSIVVSDPRAMTRTVVDAIERSGVHAILSKGWSDRLQAKGDGAEPEVPLPKQVYQIQSVPHDWLFQRIDAACHHGGAGTTGASLRGGSARRLCSVIGLTVHSAGIPTIIKPFFGDQFFWADRVEALGIGSGVRTLTVEALTEALVSATTDTKQIERARAVGEQIRKVSRGRAYFNGDSSCVRFQENGVANAIQAMYRDMDYARSLIKRKADETAAEGEGATIREAHGHGDESPSYESDWDVVEDSDSPERSGEPSRRASLARRASSKEPAERPALPKRTSIMTNMLSALPDALSPAALGKGRGK